MSHVIEECAPGVRSSARKKYWHERGLDPSPGKKKRSLSDDTMGGF
jgi:hypothetical protein